MRGCLIAILFLALPSAAIAQGLPEAPLPMSTVLPEMNKRAQTLAKGHKELRKYADAINRGALWLEERLREDDPAEYRLQLTIDNALLERALAHPEEALGILRSVSEDVDLKNRDCWKFGHGRRVPVEIRTVRRGVEEGGWQVYYRWLPPNNLQLQVAEMSFPNPSSPSLWELPAGMYEIRIEKRDDLGNLQKSGAMVIPVGTEDKAKWNVQIP